jgi:hypothetical protein
MKGAPQSQVDMIVEIIDKNPELFEKIGKEIKELTDKGRDQMAASMEVMRKYQSELAKIKR